MLRVVHYLNQFFGGLGGEDKAEAGPRLHEGPVGPGRAIQNALGERGKVVASVICGDNYFAENIEKASEEIVELVRDYEPDIFLAGPAFDAGRYGIACGAACQAMIDVLDIAAVTGMHEENPGLVQHRNPCPLGKVRVQWLCHLNDPFVTTKAELSPQLSQGVTNEPFSQTITDDMALPISHSMGTEISIPSSHRESRGGG